MNPQKFLQQLISIGFILLLLIGCSTPATPNTPTATSIPPTSTSVPMLTDGTDSWSIKKVILQQTLTVNNQTLDAGSGNVYLQVEFECVTGKMPPFPTRAGGGPDYTQLYVIDGDGQKYLAEQFGVTFSGSSLENCTSFFVYFEPIPEESSNFALHFADLAPISLGQ